MITTVSVNHQYLCLNISDRVKYLQLFTKKNKGTFLGSVPCDAVYWLYYNVCILSKMHFPSTNSKYAIFHCHRIPDIKRPLVTLFGDTSQKLSWCTLTICTDIPKIKNGFFKTILFHDMFFLRADLIKSINMIPICKTLFNE